MRQARSKLRRGYMQPQVAIRPLGLSVGVSGLPVLRANCHAARIGVLADRVVDDPPYAGFDLLLIGRNRTCVLVVVSHKRGTCRDARRRRATRASAASCVGSSARKCASSVCTTEVTADT